LEKEVEREKDTENGREKKKERKKRVCYSKIDQERVRERERMRTYV